MVSQLITAAFRERWGDRTHLIEMFAHENRPATLAEKLRFALAIGGAQVMRRTDWILFAHLGLAQVQTAVPAGVRRPYAVFLHGIEAWQSLGARQLAALKGADLRLANSAYTALRVMREHPGVGTVVACPLSLPLGFATAPADASPPFPIGKHAVLVVGRMLESERYKGHDELLDAWPAIVSRVPDAQLIVVGEGDDAPRLKAKAAGRPGGDRVVFTGFVSAARLRALYERAALFVLPSRGEGFGLVYLEAMTHGLACVGSVHDAAAEVVVDGVTGRLVDQDQPCALTGAIADLLIDDEGRRAMGLRGRDRVAREFSFDRFSRRLFNVIESSRPSPRHS